MEIRAITVNAADTAAAGRGVQGFGPLNVNQEQAEGRDIFGAECRVTISRKGKELSRQQAEQAETDTRSAQSLRGEKRLLHQQEQIRLSKEIRDGYREKLNEIEKEIEGYNTSDARFDKSKASPANMAMISETIEEREKLKTTLENQKQFQAEENQRLAKEARQMAMQAAGYQDEIDENNRELATLLKTVEEAEKAEEEREGGEAAESGSDTGASAEGNSVGDVIGNAATHFMASSTNREWRVEEMMDNLEAAGNWYVDTADSITRNVLQGSAGIRAAMDDPGAFTDEQIAEMMEAFQEGMRQNLDDVRDFRSFGLEVLRDTRDIRRQHTADAPLQGMQEAKDSMMLSAVDAAIGEERQGALNKASQKLADEVEELIDERNDVDGIRQDEEQDEEEQDKKTEDKKAQDTAEQAEMQTAQEYQEYREYKA